MLWPTTTRRARHQVAPQLRQRHLERERYPVERRRCPAKARFGGVGADSSITDQPACVRMGGIATLQRLASQVPCATGRVPCRATATLAGIDENHAATLALRRVAQDAVLVCATAANSNSRSRTFASRPSASTARRCSSACGEPQPYGRTASRPARHRPPASAQMQRIRSRARCVAFLGCRCRQQQQVPGRANAVTLQSDSRSTAAAGAFLQHDVCIHCRRFQTRSRRHAAGLHRASRGLRQSEFAAGSPRGSWGSAARS